MRNVYERIATKRFYEDIILFNIKKTDKITQPVLFKIFYKQKHTKQGDLQLTIIIQY